jgi:hypothetical protein
MYEATSTLGCSLSDLSLLKFHLVQRIIPKYIWNQYPKPWVQYIRGS